eukprot:CAMPEP_0182923418 /NCGR_PEP_ID=MMETSP0105_2-20130417/5415_1 /TAXON_ID=81532 ORGANISM="Acanthoeca-like sp., Strain 10tr" /NCGR_SAMPLE_ID=MMETSP0105_2 /ASSEMBLY_ACC=CAM_ASM_000205 /LENGTH=58 /DNA_ID=CAMNT_0025061129 /DNA_START=243 /DNA_END=419 /DNA_ORIENTATION=+
MVPPFVDRMLTPLDVMLTRYAPGPGPISCQLGIALCGPSMRADLVDFGTAIVTSAGPG